MSIQDFYRKFVSMSEENTLVETLRRLSLYEDPKAMFGEEPAADWSQWSDSSESMVAGQA
jgi:hypothetical protein